MSGAHPSRFSTQGTAHVPRWGVAHVHTDHSDGNRSVGQVVEAAERAGLDFVVLTDHNTIDARCDEGYHGQVLVAVEIEITPSPFRGHLLALGLEHVAPDLHERGTGAIFSEIRSQGALAWVPHPRGFWNPWIAAYNAAWRDWNQPVDGIELSTFLVDWAVGLRPWNLHSRLVRGVLGRSMPTREVLARWDELNQTRSVVGFVGLDAHYREALGGRLRTPAYETLFRTHQIIAWTPPPTGDPVVDLAALRGSLRDGRFASVLGAGLGRAAIHWELRHGGGLHLDLHTDDPVEVQLVKDGQRCRVEVGSDGYLAAAEPGVYRAEVYREGQLWLLTNPIRVPAPTEGDPARETGGGVRLVRSRE